MSDTEQTPAERAALYCAEIRRTLDRKLANLDRAEAIMARLPIELIERCIVFSRDDMTSEIELMICNLSRETTLAALKTLGGHWTKKINPSYPDRIDYNQVIDGVAVEIYAAPPPASCRIVTEKVELPARTETRTRLVCT